MRRNVDLVRTVRQAVGDGVEIAGDAYMGWDFGYTVEMAKRLREFNLSWIEEPLMPEQVERYAELKDRLPWQRWSCGENPGRISAGDSCLPGSLIGPLMAAIT